MRQDRSVEWMSALPASLRRWGSRMRSVERSDRLRLPAFPRRTHTRTTDAHRVPCLRYDMARFRWAPPVAPRARTRARARAVRVPHVPTRAGMGAATTTRQPRRPPVSYTHLRAHETGRNLV